MHMDSREADSCKIDVSQLDEKKDDLLWVADCDLLCCYDNSLIT